MALQPPAPPRGRQPEPTSTRPQATSHHPRAASSPGKENRPAPRSFSPTKAFFAKALAGRSHSPERQPPSKAKPTLPLPPPKHHGSESGSGSGSSSSGSHHGSHYAGGTTEASLRHAAANPPPAANPSPTKKHKKTKADRRDASASASSTASEPPQPPNRPSATTEHKSSGQVAAEFANLLTELQVPLAQRSKLLGLDVRVKAAMLKASSSLSLSSFGLAPDADRAPPAPQRVTQSSSWGSFFDGHIDSHGAHSDAGAPPPAKTASTEDIFTGVAAAPAATTSRERSPAAPAPLSLATVPPPQPHPPPSSSSHPSSKADPPPRLATAGGGAPSADSAASFSAMLLTTATVKLDLLRLKRLRVVVASEAPGWSADFVARGGGGALLAHLRNLLDMEWREEQRDDKLLHEILRCLLSLSGTDSGRAVLASAVPSPFVALGANLFSEKKPGDLTTRRHLVELLRLLVDLEVAQPRLVEELEPQRQLSSCWSAARENRAHLGTGATLLLLLLHNERDARRECVVGFVAASHAVRAFKHYVVELSGVCRDYFWVFCHAQNRFWRLEDVDVRVCEAPKVPGGMTGGVEFEAMAYVTANLKLVNRLVEALMTAGMRGRAGTRAAYELHATLFASGFERVLATLRRASQTYYAPLHLEMARYLNLTSAACFALPPNIAAWQATPRAAPSLQEQMRSARNTSAAAAAAAGHAPPMTSTSALAALDVQGQRRASPTSASPPKLPPIASTSPERGSHGSAPASPRFQPGERAQSGQQSPRQRQHQRENPQRQHQQQRHPMTMAVPASSAPRGEAPSGRPERREASGWTQESRLRSQRHAEHHDDRQHHHEIAAPRSEQQQQQQHPPQCHQQNHQEQHRRQHHGQQPACYQANPRHADGTRQTGPTPYAMPHRDDRGAAGSRGLGAGLGLGLGLGPGFGLDGDAPAHVGPPLARRTAATAAAAVTPASAEPRGAPSPRLHDASATTAAASAPVDAAASLVGTRVRAWEHRSRNAPPPPP